MPGSLIIAGTGDPEDLVQSAASLLFDPDEVVLVAPVSPDRGTAALTAVKVLGERRHFDGVLGAEPGETELVRYNLPGLQSTKPPSRSLRDLFPGLLERSRKSVARHSIIEVLAARGELPAPIYLRLAELGSEAEIMTALEERGLLDRLEKVSLRCGREAMFEGSWSCSQIREWLMERHFRLEVIDESDPDFPELIMVRDAAAAKIAELESRIVALGAAHKADLAEAVDRLKATEKQAFGAETKLAEMEEQLTSRAAELDAQAKSHAGQVANLEAQLAEMEEQLISRAAELDAQAKSHAGQVANLEAQLAEREEQLTSRAAELDAQAKSHAGQVANLEAKLAEWNRIIEQRIAERDAKAKALDETQTKLENLRKSTQESITSFEAQIEKNTRVKADLEQKLIAAEKELSSNRAAVSDSRNEQNRMSADLSLALKTQALLCADIQALREKLRISELERESHQDLLRRLTPKLHQAASQIREMHLVDTLSKSPGRSELAVGTVPAEPNRKKRKKR